MVLVGWSAGRLSAASLVGAILTPAFGQNVLCAGPHDIRLRDLYRQFSAGDFDAMKRGFDPGIMLTVPFDGFPFPGTYVGADAALSYFQRVAAKQGPDAVIPKPMKIGASTPYDFRGSNLTAYGGLCAARS